MPEPTPAPAAPAPAPTEQQQSQPQQPQRGPDGKFAPAPKPGGQPEAARRLKLPTGEELDEEEVLATAAERRLENRALQARLKRLEELEALEAKWKKDPRQALSREERRRLALEEAREWQAEQEEANLPPEEKALRQRERALREREEKIRAEEERRTKEAEEAQMEQLRTEAVETVKTALKLSGLPQTASTAKRLLGVMATAARNGVAFPPEVLARKLRAAHDAETAEHMKALGAGQVLKRYGLVEMLNSLEGDELLDLLEPLGERLRKRAMAKHGMAPPAQPSNVRQLPTQAPKPGQREDPFEVQKRIEARVRGK